MIIDQLPNLASVQETDEIPVERGTTTYKATFQKLKDLFLSFVTKATVGLNNVDNVRQYSADNPPPYPVPSPTIYFDTITTTVNTAVSKSFAVSGNGFVIVSASVFTDTTSDVGQATATISLGSTTYASNLVTIDTARAYPIGASASASMLVSNGNSINIVLRGNKSGTKTLIYNILCFGCTVSAS